MPIRIEESTLDQLKAFADHYGRSLNREIEIAIEALIHQHALALLEDPEVRRERGAAYVREQRKRTRAAYEEVLATAFSRGSAVDPLDALDQQRAEA